MLTNFLESNLSWETTSPSDIEEFPNILFNPKFTYVIVFLLVSFLLFFAPKPYIMHMKTILML
jgi:hypothetical protein